MPIQDKPPKSKAPQARTSADVIHYGKVFRPYGKEWVENGLTSHVPIPTIIELIHQNIPAKRNSDLTSLKKTALVSILMKFYDKTNNSGKKRIEQWVYTHRYRRKIQFDNPFVEKINKFLNHLKTFESPKFTVTPATASKIFNELTITGITSLSEVRSVLKSNIVKSSIQEKAFNPIFNEWFLSDLSKYTNSPSRVKIIPDALSALDPSSSQSSQTSQSSDDIESLLTEFRQIVSGAGNSEGEYIPNEASNEHTESPEIPQDPNDTDDFEDEPPEEEPPELPEKLEPKSDTSPSYPDSDKEDDSDETSEEDESVSDSSSQSDLPEDLEEETPEEDEKNDEQNPKFESDSSENDEDSEEEPEPDEPDEPEDDFGETSDSSEETEAEQDVEEPPQDEPSNSNSETDEEKDEDSGDSSEDKDKSEEDSSDEKEEINENESEEETESDKDEEPQQDGDSESTTEPLRERPLVKEQVKDMILKIANSEDSTIDELRHHTKEQLNIT